MALPMGVERVVQAGPPGDTVTIRVGGTLDSVGAAALVDSMRAELDRGPARIEVDLTSLDGYDHTGLEALCACRSMSSGLPDGLHFRTDGGAGQDALLTAFTDDEASTES